MVEFKIKSSDNLIEALRKVRGNVLPSEEKFMRRYAAETPGGVEETTLDDYYVDMINDTLREIRKGKVAYIFNFGQVIDILRYEPKARFQYEDGAIAVRLPRRRAEKCVRV